MLNCYCQLSSSVIFRQYGVSQSECKINRPRPGLSRFSPRPHTKALGTRLQCCLNARILNHFISNSKFFDKRVILKEHFKTSCEAFEVEFYLKLKLILHIITYTKHIYVWGIDNFVIKSDIFRGFFICKNILQNYRVTKTTTLKTSCSENTMVLSARRRVSACMHVFSSTFTYSI
jgi:hypothetical protein